MDTFQSETIPDPAQTPGPVPAPTPEHHGGFRRFILDIIETVLLSLVLFLGINAVSARIRVESVSMQPTLYEGDFVIVNRVAYKIGRPSRGDVVIFHYPPNPTIEPYIKRVIGLPGDQITVKEGQVFINGAPMREPYIKAPPAYTGSWTVPDGQLFVLGDNRNNSSDSHSWGMVPIDNVIGKAEVVYWPPQDWRVFNQTTTAAAAEEH